MDRIGKLKQAAGLVREVVDDLNTREHECGECHHRVYEDWDDVQAFDQLNGVLNKLVKWMDTFDRKGKS